ncbi:MULTISPECIES: hypothetical protein [unclassified Rhizobium]|uniref:hypothetical protein n=1 Tax=unclassified Rhizobium TaxID=2613769 RepID=UPI00161F6765|nr:MULTISPECIES: hypothetical protein [unclassified Rhizobium]MBB3385524.1 hypothetical protein [Rhizobium sp. BK098]MBB3617229.1 hypothetical protein [Rhizobium sp. BK609]MBB3682935.1 hypothetical protein [Rhizobium sp. BK612]
MQTYLKTMEADIAGALLYDRLRRSPASSAINGHLNSVESDEAQFDDNGGALDAAAAVETRRAEIRSFREFRQTTCDTAEDVQAKIRYLLHGTLGERQTLVECLMDAAYGWGDAKDGLELFLKSLLVEDFTDALTHARAPAHPRTARGAHTREGD